MLVEETGSSRLHQTACKFSLRQIPLNSDRRGEAAGSFRHLRDQTALFGTICVRFEEHRYMYMFEVHVSIEGSMTFS